MGELIEKNPKLCKGCKYHTKIIFMKKTYIACYYARIKQKSRRLEMGKPLYPECMCDKYEPLGCAKKKDEWHKESEIRFGNLKKEGKR